MCHKCIAEAENERDDVLSVASTTNTKFKSDSDGGEAASLNLSRTKTKDRIVRGTKSLEDLFRDRPYQRFHFLSSAKAVHDYGTRDTKLRIKDDVA